MEIRAAARVFTSDGNEVGLIDRVVIEPRTKEVTHIVIRKGMFLTEDRVLPIDRIESSTGDRVVLLKDTDPLETYPKFESNAYIQIPLRPVTRPEPGVGYPSSVYPYVPIGPITMQYSGYPVTASERDQMVDDVNRRNIPEGTVALKEGAKVISEDDRHVGNIERVYIDPEGGKATHFLISKGVLFKERKVIPVSWINRVAEDEVLLAVDQATLEQVPDHREKDTPGGYV